MFHSDIYVDKFSSVVWQICMEENLDQLIRICVSIFSFSAEPVFLDF